MSKYHFVYKTICTSNNKFYYGVHSTNNINDGYLGPICPVIIDGIEYASQSAASKVHRGGLSSLRKKYNTNEFISINGRLRPKNIECKRNRKPHSEKTKEKISNTIKARVKV